MTRKHSKNSKGKLVIISGPSGAGKSSVVKELLKKPDTVLSVSATTRPQREGESDSVHYHFISHEEFERLVEKDWFAEHFEVYSNYYGTPRRPLEEAIAGGMTYLLDVDVQGAQRMKEEYPDAISIFILPFDIETLEERLRGRQTDDESVIKERLDSAKMEIERHGEFDHRVVNDDLERVVKEIELILEEHRG